MSEIITLGRASQFKAYEQRAKEKAFAADILILTNKKGYSNTGIAIGVYLNTKTLSLYDIGSTTKLSEIQFDISNLKLFFFITALEALPKRKGIGNGYFYDSTVRDLKEIAEILVENKLL